MLCFILISKDANSHCDLCVSVSGYLQHAGCPQPVRAASDHINAAFTPAAMAVSAGEETCVACCFYACLHCLSSAMVAAFIHFCMEELLFKIYFICNVDIGLL